MKRIAIITFHKALNYGSVLQTWATQDLLIRRGYDVNVIDYEPKCYKQIYGVFKTEKRFSSLKFNLKRLPVFIFMANRANGFSNFRQKKLKLSEKQYYYNSDLSELSQKYDCVICGSDQIWNVKIKDCDPIYFMAGATGIKKIAYAVSMGNSDFTSCTEKEREQYKKWISEYAHISVREEKTIGKIGDLLEKPDDIICTLDPTLLHQKEDFYAVSGKRLIKEDYVFLYNIWNPEDGFQMAKNVSKRLGLPVYTIMTIKNLRMIARVTKLSIKLKLLDSAPEDYISLIRYASFVITDSFHGTAFSIIFEKPFVCVNYQKEDGSMKNDVRLRNVLGFFGLGDRYVSKQELESLDITIKPDYKTITNQRMTMAAKSIDWLINAIEN